MATQAQPTTTHADRTPPRIRRWWVIAAIIALSLGVYAVGLSWAIGHVETGVENSIRLAPGVAQANDSDTPMPGSGNGLE